MRKTRIASYPALEFDDGGYSTAHPKGFDDSFMPDEKFKNRSPLLVKISIFDLDTGEQIRDHTRDIRKSKNRQWLTNAMIWAITNNKRIEIRRK